MLSFRNIHVVCHEKFLYESIDLTVQRMPFIHYIFCLSLALLLFALSAAAVAAPPISQPRYASSQPPMIYYPSVEAACRAGMGFQYARLGYTYVDYVPNGESGSY
jgi:hypothetical protein